MRRLRAALLASSWTLTPLLLALPLAGCAAISGLDGISEQACAPDCDGGGGGDGTLPNGDDGSSPGPDATMSGDDSAAPDSTMAISDDGAMRPDTATNADAARDGSDAAASDSGHDATVEDSGLDATMPDSGRDGGQGDTGVATLDSGVDTGAGAVDSGLDSGPDTGPCGPTNTIDNCSACGDKCNVSYAPTCNGTTCSYSCGAGLLDCNATIAPDLDGCECNAPGATLSQCCAKACPQAHHYDLDLVGTTFYDCVAQGTINQSVAMDACNAYMGDTTHCDTGGVTTFYCTFPDGGVVGDMVCSNGSTTKDCACWGYDGQLTGLMQVGTGTGNNNCPCPTPSGPKWN